MINMFRFVEIIKRHFPHNKQVWKRYLFTSIPVILSAMVFALNAFVDNFMSTNIEGGNQALSYANTWTELQIGIISTTTVVGASIFAQYLGKRDIHSVKQVINFRILFSLSIAILFAIPSWITPNNMIRLISGFDNDIVSSAFNNAIIYLRLITISWIINSIWFTMSIILREKKHAIASFISSLISLIINVILNSIFIYGLKLGIEFLAYSTIISNIVSLSFVFLFIIVRDREILINPFKIFKISFHILLQFIRRSSSFILLAIGSILITIRFVFWNIGYPTGSIANPEYMLSAANILGISGMFFNIFWTTLESVNANINIYVGRKLGKSDFEIAKKNAKELQGFHLILATIMGLSLFLFSFVIEHMRFLARGYELSLIASNPEINQTTINEAITIFMSNLKFTLWPLSFFMPMFIWFITKSRTISAGGHTNIVALIEAISSGLQIAWLCLIAYVFNKNNQLPFPWAYFIFFLSDIPKMIVYEIVFYRINWLRNITEIDKRNWKYRIKETHFF